MLVALCAVVAFWFTYSRSRVAGGFEVNHVTLFSFGYLFYWVLPLAVAPIVGDQVAGAFKQLFESSEQTTIYLWTILLSYTSFIVGDTAAIKLFPLRSAECVPLHQGALFLGVLPLCVSGLTFAVMYRSLLFQPYGIDVEAERARGTIAACVVILGSISLLYISDHAQHSFRQLATSRFVLPFVTGCLFMLLLGSRLYVITFALMMFVYRSCFVQPLSLKTLVIGGSTLGSLSGLVGIFRVSDSTSVWLNVILEPLFTSLSLLYFLNFNKLAWIAFPKYLLTDLFNLIPTAFFPGKTSLFEFPYVYTPLGAQNSYISFAFNFGIIGTVVFMFFVSVILRWLRSRSARQLPRVAYTMISGWLAFSFFRDPFGVSLVKAMLEFSIIVPALIVGFNRAIQNTVPLRATSSCTDGSEGRQLASGDEL